MKEKMLIHVNRKKYKIILKDVILGFILFVFLTQPIFSSDHMKKESVIISPGGQLIKYSLINGTLKKRSDLLPDKQWSNAYWPTYDREKGLIYFEAENKEFGWSRSIFYIDINDEKQHPIKIIEGRRPSVSPDGRSLAYYQHPNQLWILELESQKNKKIVSDILDCQPVVWISNQQLLYADATNHLIRLNIVSENAENTGHNNILPGALSPDGYSVLCGSYDGSKISIYTVKTNELTVLKKSIFFSMGSSFVWSHDGKSFLYTRQTLSNLIKLDEIRSLFLYSLAGKEIKLIDKFSLFGGVSE